MNFFLRILVVLFCITAVESTNAQTLQFTENKGQWNSRVKFKTDFGGGALFLQPNGYRVLLNNKDDLARIAEKLHAHKRTGGDSAGILPKIKEAIMLRSQAYEVSFIGASSNGRVIPDKAVSTSNNYFIGGEAKQWVSNCKIYQGVTFTDIYPGIDVRYYTNNGKLKYDLIVHPGADAGKIALKFEGINKLGLRKNNLAVQTDMGEVTELKPYSYQFDNIKGRRVVIAKFIVKDNVVRFKTEAYDKTATLVIDPTLIFSSFTGSVPDNWGYTATFDGSGNFYAGGIAFGTGYPVTLGVFQSQFGGGEVVSGLEGFDVAITKFSADGSKRLYATYLGGGGNEQPHSMIVDKNGDLVVAGRTSSPDFPVTAPVYGTGGRNDIFISKISADGSRLLASRKFGGTGDDGVNIADKEVPVSQGNVSIRRNYGDDARSEVIVDNSNNIYLASCTQSSTFPVTAGAFQKNFGGGLQDGVLIKVSPGLSTVLFSSYLGGSGNDAAFVLSLNPFNNNIYVGGGTASSNMPGTGGNTGPILLSNYGGGETDGFISIINNDGSQLIKTCYAGTNGNDIVYGVQFDKFGFPYMTGTTSVAFPVINSAFNTQQNGKQFITKMQPDLSGVVYSTNFGKGQGSPDLSITAFLVDRCENVYVAGWGGGIDHGYPNAGTNGLSVTSDAIRNFTDGHDFYFFVLEKNALSQLYGSFFGNDDRGITQGLIGDHVDGGTSRFDREGVIYEAICANCGGLGIFPTTPGVVGPSNGGGTIAKCNEAAVKIAFELAGVGSGVRAAAEGIPRDTSGCVPLIVDFTDTIATGKSFIWNFGDGSAEVRTTSPSVSHTYNAVGNYRVRLISIDSLTCNISDTSFTNIRVRDDKADISLLTTKLPPCESLQYRFDNTSKSPPNKPFGLASFTWNFGDGTTVIAGTNSVIHNFPAPGTYNISLQLTDTSYCNSNDSATLQLRIAPNVKALFETPPYGCAPYDAVFNNVSLAGQQFFWDFGDGSPVSTAISPAHTYLQPGTYTIRMTAIDSSTCNIIDSTQQTITVSEKPTASFSAAPQPPLENTPITFTNFSFGGTRFIWDFGDGDTLITTRVDTLVRHQYNATDTFIACLYAYNDFGCVDTMCMGVSSIIVPLVDVPNAFTPNGDGVNDRVTPKGFGIQKTDFRIYNRWGALVFQSFSDKVGWDGRYKGTLQPQDVYVYVLDITFTDKTKVRKTGDITLLQ